MEAEKAGDPNHFTSKDQQLPPHAQKIENGKAPFETQKTSAQRRGDRHLPETQSPPDLRYTSDDHSRHPNFTGQLGYKMRASSWVARCRGERAEDDGGRGRGAWRWLLGGPPMTGECGTATVITGEREGGPGWTPIAIPSL